MLSIGKETRFWKYLPSFFSTSALLHLVDEKERLHKLINETKKTAGKEVANAKAAACQKFYEDVESLDGNKIAIQR